MNKRIKILLALAIILVAMLVLNYKISYASDNLVSPATNSTVSEDAEGIPGNKLPAKLTKGVSSGKLTQEQYEEAKKDYEAYTNNQESTEYTPEEIAEEEAQERLDQQHEEEKSALIGPEKPKSEPNVAIIVVIVLVVIAVVVAVLIKLGIIPIKSKNVK